MAGKGKQITRESELSKLKKIFKSVPADAGKLLQPLIENAAFMAEQLDILQKEIEKNGCTEEYQNGANQRGVKKSAAVEVYNTMLKNYTAVIKQLAEFLPDNSAEKDQLIAFITSHR